MPVMDICEEDGSLSWWAPYMVNATMWYPRDEEKFLSVTAACVLEDLHYELGKDRFIEKVTSVKELAEILQWSPENLLHAPARFKVLEDAMAPQAYVAGMILIYLICAKTHHCELDPKLTTIIATYSDLLKEARDLNGELKPCCERTLWRYWGEYKPVSHLWAASLADSFGEDMATYDFAEMRSERIDELITFSEELREMGRKFRLLDPGETWRAPDPLVPRDLVREPPPLPDEFLDLLKKRTLGKSKSVAFSAPEIAEDVVEAPPPFRVMDLCNADGELDGQASIILNATMWYPRDDELREEVVELMTLAEVISNEDFEKELWENEGLRDPTIELMRSVIWRRDLGTVLEAALEHSKSAIAAGDILLYLICTSHHDRDGEFKPTLTRVIDALSRWDKYPNKRGFLESKWKDFKPAAHLWAAVTLHLMNSPKDPNSVVDELANMDVDGFRRFVTLAEQIREYGEEMRFLDASESWRAPDEFVRSADRFDPAFPPPEEFLELLRTYRPRHSRLPE